MNEKLKSLLIKMFRYILAFIFLVSALEKFKSLENFALSIDAYRIFGEGLINFLTITVPSIELFIAFAIIFDYRLTSTLFLYLIMMLSFTALVIFAMIKGLDISCGCFGESSTKVGIKKLIENLLIIVVNILVLRFELKKEILLIR